MKLHFKCSKHEQAKKLFNEMVGRYNQHQLDEAEVIIALGGDGQMLSCLKDSIDYEIPVFGLNCGHVGFLMNEYKQTDLIERIQNAETAPIHPLLMQARQINGEQKEVQSMLANCWILLPSFLSFLYKCLQHEQ